MRKLLTTSAVIASLAILATIAAPTSAKAQYYGGYSNQRVYPSYRAYPAPTYRPFFSTPRYYPGGGYYDYRRYGPVPSTKGIPSLSTSGTMPVWDP